MIKYGMIRVYLPRCAKGIQTLNRLDITKLRIRTRITEDVALPGFLGNTIRGALGRALVEIYCDEKEKTSCDGCGYTEDCVYATVFKCVYRDEQFPSVPNPFVVKVPYTNKRNYAAGWKLEFDVALFGCATRYVREIASAFVLAFCGEFAGKRGCVVLEGIDDAYTGERVLDVDGGRVVRVPEPVVWSDENAASIAETTSLSVTFLTPVQMMHNSAIVEDFDFPTFMDAVFSRTSAIIDLYGEGAFMVPYGLTYRKPYVKAEQNLRKVFVKQERGVMEGVVGKVKYEGDLTRYVSYIDLGSVLHVGKLSTRGFGWYRYEMGE